MINWKLQQTLKNHLHPEPTWNAYGPYIHSSVDSDFKVILDFRPYKTLFPATFFDAPKCHAILAKWIKIGPRLWHTAKKRLWSHHSMKPISRIAGRCFCTWHPHSRCPQIPQMAHGTPDLQGLLTWTQKKSAKILLGNETLKKIRRGMDSWDLQSGTTPQQRLTLGVGGHFKILKIVKACWQQLRC